MKRDKTLVSFWYEDRVILTATVSTGTGFGRALAWAKLAAGGVPAAALTPRDKLGNEVWAYSFPRDGWERVRLFGR